MLLVCEIPPIYIQSRLFLKLEDTCIPTTVRVPFLPPQVAAAVNHLIVL